MASYLLDLQEIDRTQAAIVGGKGAQLGELTRIAGIRVPPGFCVTTHAFRQIVTGAPSLAVRLEQLSHLDPDDHQAIRTRSAEIRGTIETIAIPDDLRATITAAVARLGQHAGYAVRSSATAEDLPAASFAGMHDSYLNVVGPPAIVSYIGRCWASLFTERAVTYRLRNGFDHRTILMAVVVQQMAFAEAAGILFTADPVTGNRKVAAVEATVGLGDGLVSGRAKADTHHVRDDKIIAQTIVHQQLAVHASPAGGTREQAIDPSRPEQPALTDTQVVKLVQLGRRIEAHFGAPQDVEWCLVDDGFQFVQSRPITTLFPIPAVDDHEHHIFVSVGHGQMMTDPMKPLGLSIWQLTALRPMYVAGGRLFVDVATGLAAPASRAGLLEVLGRGDPLIGDALRTVIDRSGLVASVPANATNAGTVGPPAADAPDPIDTDPAIVTELIAQCEASMAALRGQIRTKSGPALLDFISADLAELKRFLVDPRSHQAVMAGMEATWWLNQHLEEWLGEKNVADTLTRSAPHNVTSEMGLALLDVADAIRPHPEVVAFLPHVDDGGFLDQLAALAGGPEARNAIASFLDRYGMRCVGEIDITRPRWSERPSTLVPVILGNIENFTPGEATRRFERGQQEARTKEHEVLQRLGARPDGEREAAQTKQAIDRVRTFIGYREYPKYVIVSRYFVYKQALLQEAERLVQAGVLRERDDIFSLTFDELHDVVLANHVDDELIRQRQDAFRSYQALTPPRVLTSDGEVFNGSYRRDDAPEGALVGLPVSSGTIEGRARVIHDLADADLDAGDILVTTHTDPSWSPLFVSIAGLVTEVGGLMTHGAVIAREYGLPAVVGVEHATRLIPDGRRIRVHGTDGYVELL